MTEKVYVNNISKDRMVNVGADESEGILLHEVAFDASAEQSDAPSPQVEKVFLPEEYKSLCRHGYYTRTV